MTMGVYTAAKRSTNAWDLARRPSASSTSCTILAMVDSAANFVVRTSSAPYVFSVPANTSAPALFSAGTDSPVTAASSTAEAPRTTTPSTGIFSPGRTRTTSPTAMSSTGTTTSAPLRSTVARWGAASIRSRMERRARSYVHASSQSDTANKTATTAASCHSPMARAPMTAAVMSTLMLKSSRGRA